jgi:hypothetical protein
MGARDAGARAKFVVRANFAIIAFMFTRGSDERLSRCVAQIAS